MFEYIYIDDTGIEIALDNKFKERTCYLRRVPIPHLGPLSRKSDKWHKYNFLKMVSQFATKRNDFKMPKIVFHCRFLGGS